MHLQEGFSGRMGVRLWASALLALCAVACLQTTASATPTIAGAPTVTLGKATRASQLFDSQAFSGWNISYWNLSLKQGDHIFIKTKAADGGTPPCQLIFPPGTTDQNIGPTATL